jgi:hypothetical protein
MKKNKTVTLLSYSLVITLAFILAPIFGQITIQHVLAETCSGAWDITDTSGIKTNYQLGETISGNISFKISNSADCPRCTQQILIALIDSQGYLAGWTCIFDDIPQVCPDSTTGKVDITLRNPNYPGTYRIIASNEKQRDCFDAFVLGDYHPKITAPQMQIATIKVAASNAINEPSVPTPPPSFPEPSSNNLPTILLFSANPSSIKKGESTRISWEVVDATQIFITPEPGRAAPKGGYTTAQLSEPTTYTLTATNSYGSVTGEITVNIIGVSPPSSSLNELPTLPTGGIADTIDATLLRIKTWIQQLIHFVLTVLLPIACIVIIGIIVWRNRKPRPNAKNAAYVYIMYNPSYKKDCYKVGRSRNPERRAEELSAPTGVAGKFEVKFKLWVTDAVLVEKCVHKKLEHYRLHDNKEFFELPINTIKDTIREYKN